MRTVEHLFNSVRKLFSREATIIFIYYLKGPSILVPYVLTNSESFYKFHNTRQKFVILYK